MEWPLPATVLLRPSLCARFSSACAPSASMLAAAYTLGIDWPLTFLQAPTFPPFRAKIRKACAVYAARAQDHVHFRIPRCCTPSSDAEARGGWTRPRELSLKIAFLSAFYSKTHRETRFVQVVSRGATNGFRLNSNMLSLILQSIDRGSAPRSLCYHG